MTCEVDTIILHYFRNKKTMAQRNEIIHPRDMNLSSLTLESVLSTMVQDSYIVIMWTLMNDSRMIAFWDQERVKENTGWTSVV